MKKIFIACLFLPLSLSCMAITKHVLFIGNSYTSVNNLPQLVADLAMSTNDTIIYDSYAPGGYTLKMHSTDATTISKILTPGWDYVVLQEQSQIPAFPQSQVNADCFPYATILDSMVKAGNPCARTVFFMTWGRKNGDASNCATWPPICTYNGMDSMLRDRYLTMAIDNKAIVAPAGPVWRYVRTNAPLIDLYQADESHPSSAGSYAAACAMYSSILRKDPSAITSNAGLPSADAAAIRNAAKAVAYDSSATWKVNAYDINGSFNIVPGNALAVSCFNTTSNALGQQWLINGVVVDTAYNLFYSLPGFAVYTITLLCFTACDTIVVDSIYSNSLSAVGGVHGNSLVYYPCPASQKVFSSLFIASQKIVCVDAKGNKQVLIARNNEIDIEHLPNGAYILLITAQSGAVRREKIIVQQ